MVLLVRNKVTYADYVTNSAKLTRFWINHPDRVMIRNEMLSRGWIDNLALLSI